MGRFYSEEAMGALRARFEAKVLTWPGVKGRQMFGCPCYDAAKMFAFLVTNGVVVTRLSEADRVTLSKRRGVAPFQPMGRAVSKWLQVPVKTGRDIDAVLPWVEKSYRAVRKK